jgi:hypothetical protein
MRTIRLISTTAAILLLGAGAVSAQGMKNDVTTGAPAAQQNAPPEIMAPAAKSGQINTSKITGQDVSWGKGKSDPALAAAKVSPDATGNADVKSKRTARNFRGRYAAIHHGPLYNSYRGR